MKNLQKGSTNVWLIVIIVILLIVIGYLTLIRTPVVDNQQVNSAPQVLSEDEVIERLLSSWKITQSKFSIKAGESGTYNSPTEIQFISADTMFIHFDDGLVDHISLLQFKDNSFTELKLVGTMSIMSQTEWQDLVNMYGSEGYEVTNYELHTIGEIVKVPNNVFVR
jgi:hypothetical protein